MYKGFAETLYKKLKPLPGCRGVNLKVVANGNRDIMAWQGASVIASMDSFMNVRTQSSRCTQKQLACVV